MVIDGKLLSQKILKQIIKEGGYLSEKGIRPEIAIITTGPQDLWSTYVRQKIKCADSLGIGHKLTTMNASNQEKLLVLIKKHNRDKNIHGIIVQRPLPKNFDRKKIILAVDPKKDVDGFRVDSKFTPPIWLAVEEILKEIYNRIKGGDLNSRDAHMSERTERSEGSEFGSASEDEAPTEFKSWLKSKNIVVVGKGETGGEPVARGFRTLEIDPYVIDSRTNLNEKKKLLKEADVIVSAVGKERTVKGNEIKKGTILIGIGLHRGKDGKLHGDYDENDVENIASFYTPTPGGIGPLNLAFLFKNLLDAAKLQTTH